MISSVQQSQAFDAAPSIHPKKRQKFIWNEKTTAIFKSACLVLIYLNGGNLELKKERVTQGNQKSALSAKAIEHILQRGNFSEFKALSQKAMHNHFISLREKSGKRGSTLEEELLKQYQELERTTVLGDAGEEIPALWQELEKFGIKSEEYDQWLSIGNCFKWNKEKEQVFTSACLALIYLNGGKIELKKERVVNGRQKTAFSAKAIEQIIQRGNFPDFMTLPKRTLQTHLDNLRERSRKRGSTLEEELLEQYQDLEAKTIVNDKGENTTLLLEELNKFGIKPGEYDQWLSIESCFEWDEEREVIFKSACLALIYLNGGQLEIKRERMSCYSNQKTAFSAKAIEQMIQRGNFPQFKALPKGAVYYNLKWLKRMDQKNGSSWEEEILNQYQELEQATVFNEVGEEIPAIWKELEKFGVKPDDYDSWLVMEPTKQNPRKRPAEEPADPEAEPEKKRANNAN